MTIDFDKQNGLVPVIIQHIHTGQVLMLGYMNEAAWQQTQTTGVVTFFSRSRQQLWVKGETSGNFLHMVESVIDCDKDTLLIKAEPTGPTCHTGSFSCFGDEQAKGFIHQLDAIVQDRKRNPEPTSYTNKLLDKGINKVAQKVGEEAVELVIEAKDNNDELFLNEAADLVYHLQVLLAAKDKTLEDVERVLLKRHQ